MESCGKQMGFMWDGDAGALSGGKGTAKGFFNTNGAVRAKIWLVVKHLLSKMEFAQQVTKETDGLLLEQSYLLVK